MCGCMHTHVETLRQLCIGLRWGLSLNQKLVVFAMLTNDFLGSVCLNSTMLGLQACAAMSSLWALGIQSETAMLSQKEPLLSHRSPQTPHAHF